MRRIVVAMLCALAAAGAVLHADSPTPDPERGRAAPRPLKIGYVDITRALTGYRCYADLAKEQKDLRTTLITQDQARVDQIRKYAQEIEQLAMGTPERTALEEKRKKAIQEAEEFRRKGFGQLDERSVSAFRRLYGDLTREVEAVAKEGDYDLVLKDQSPQSEAANPAEAVIQISQRVVLYAKSEYDLTDAVTRRLNDKYAAEQQKAAEKKDAGKPADAPSKER